MAILGTEQVQSPLIQLQVQALHDPGSHLLQQFGSKLMNIGSCVQSTLDCFTALRFSHACIIRQRCTLVELVKVIVEPSQITVGVTVFVKNLVNVVVIRLRFVI